MASEQFIFITENETSLRMNIKWHWEYWKDWFRKFIFQKERYFDAYILFITGGMPQYFATYLI